MSGAGQNSPSPTHPVTGPRLWSSQDGAFAIAGSKRKSGVAFYMSRRCGTVRDIPLTLVISKRYLRIGNKRADSESNGAADHVMAAFYKVFARYGVRRSLDAQRLIVEAARDRWRYGHPLLAELANLNQRRRDPLWDDETTQAVFGDGYFARSCAWNPSARLKYAEIECQWEAEGRQCLPAYFRAFGVVSAEHHHETRWLAISHELRSRRRDPTNAELRGIRFLARVLADLAPEIARQLERYDVCYHIVPATTLYGSFAQHGRRHRLTICLAARVFVADFPKALAVFLHEHAHLFGGDGERAFTDALTRLIESVIRCRHQFDVYNARWLDIRASVLSERNRVESGHRNQTACKLDRMSHSELRALVERVPVDIVRPLLGHARAGAGRDHAR